jgi:hypothetical protein
MQSNFNSILKLGNELTYMCIYNKIIMKHSTHVDLIIAWILVMLSFFHEVQHLIGPRFNSKIFDQRI